MKLPETVRLDSRRKNFLVKIKRITGIKNWNSIARWAFLYSLSQTAIPSKVGENNDNAVEMSWKVFTGNEHQELIWLLLKARLIKDSIEVAEDTMRDYFQRHLYNGIHLLINDDSTNDIVDMIKNSLKKSRNQDHADLL